jgi:oligoribonuclease NrnB/cAMP/cGMP phosphodiesterase (DHH superfamily)
VIPIEKLRLTKVIYSHAHCPDGLASAMILKDAFRMLGMEPRIEFLTHGTKEHAQAGISGDGVTLFCDIAPTPDVAQLTRATGTIIVLDHHKGAEALVRSFGDLSVFADEKLDPGVSGATLAWREVWEPVNRETGTHDFLMGAVPINVKEFAYCVGARDTWQTKDPRFQRGQWISKMLMSKPAAHWLGGTRRVELENGAVHDVPERAVLPYLHESEVEMGRALFEAHEEAVRQAVEQVVAYALIGAGVDVYLYVFQEQASGFRLCSDVAEALRQQTDGRTNAAVVAGFAYVVHEPGDSPQLVYSLRGLNGFDVAAFAKANGGGGHTAAAGFEVDPHRELIGRTPYDDIRSRLAAFLKGLNP